MSTPSDLAGYHAVFGQRARTFRLAAIALPRATRDAAAVLYAFCRAADDAADDALDSVTAHHELDELELGLGGAQGATVARGVHELHCQHGLSLEAAHGLLAGVRSDIGPVRIADDAALLDYAYLVAGTVGVMMCPLLGVQSEIAQRHAADLGMAMQITNICRDVGEDARRGRVYLPLARLREREIRAEQVLDGAVDRIALRDVIAGLLARADALYESGEQGLSFLPARARLAVLIASRLYRAIGVEVLRQPGDLLGRRAVVSPWRKLRLGLVALAAWFLAPFPRRAGRPIATGGSRAG